MKKEDIRSRQFQIVKICCLLFLFFSSSAFSSEITKVAYLKKSEIKQGSRIELKDDSYVTDVIKRKSRVRLVYTRDSRTDLSVSWNYKVRYQISGSTGTPETDSLTISYTSGSTESVYEAVKEHLGSGAGYAVATLVVTSIVPTPSSSNIPSDITLELITVTERYTDLNTVAPPNIYFTAATSELSWGFVSGAEEYDAEYTFIDDRESVSPANPFTYKEPIRITTSNQYVAIDRVFPKGKIYFRVRAVGRHVTGTTDYTHVNIGSWGYGNSDVSSLSYTISTSFEASKNWNYSASFVEEGKSKREMSYVDGNEKVRQSQVSMDSDGTTLVQETKYDREGRPAVTVLPAPVANIAIADVFKFKSRFNHSVSEEEYDYEDFETTTPTAMDTAGWSASNYYSINSRLRSGDNQSLVPNAQGYPFTQTKYTRDNTGRISQTSSGAGSAHTMNGAHDVRYYYTTANSTELHRLFGSNVGVASHYKKNYVKDANGQYSVSYRDQENRVIATALIGDNPSNLVKLNENIADTLTVSLNENNILDQQEHARSQVSSFFNVGTTNYTFSYDMKGVIYKDTIKIPVVKVENEITHVVSNCPDSILVPICADCIYKLSLKITDPDGLPVTIPGATGDEFTRTFSNPDNPNCANNQYSPTGINFTVELNKTGTYTLSKVLSLDTTGINQKINTALTAAGLTNEYKTTLVTCYNNNTDFSQCDFSCKLECKTLVKQLHPGILETDSVFIFALDSCMQIICTGKINNELPSIFSSECDVMLDLLKEEVSPDGFEFFQNNPYVAGQTDTTFWTRVGNLMYDYDILSTAQKALVDPADRHYIVLTDENNMIMDPQPSVSYLKNSLNWTSALAKQWVTQLIKAHRDYCHYENCIKLKESRAYDVKMTFIKNWTDAKAGGYLDPMGMSSYTTGSDFLGFPNNVGLSGNYVFVDSVYSGIDPIFKPKRSVISSCMNRGVGPDGNGEDPAPESRCNAYNSLAVVLRSGFYDGPGVGQGHHDLWHYVYNPSSILYSGTDPVYTDEMKWKLFRAYYLDEKHKWENNSMTLSLCNCCPYYPDSKIKGHPMVSEAYVKNNYDIANDCGEKCGLNVIHWMDQLEYYVGKTSGCTAWTALTASDLTGIKLNLLQFCQSTCGVTNPQGFITDTALSPLNPYLNNVKGILTSRLSCGATMLDSLSVGHPYDIKDTTGLLTQTKASIVTSCFKEMLKFVNDLPSKSNNCHSLSNTCMGGDHLQINGTALMISSSTTCTPSTCSAHVLRFYAPNGQAIPISDILSVTLPVYSVSSPLGGISGMFKNVQCVINSSALGPIQAYVYEEVPSGCNIYAITDSMVIDTVKIIKQKNIQLITPKTDEEQKQACIDALKARNEYHAKMEYEQKVRQFREDYMRLQYANCFSSYQKENFYYTYSSKEYHFTLYYYDQAGNLVQTVPPNGVDLTTVTCDAKGNYNGAEPVHTYLTRYTYNSLNEVRSQQTPDGGLTTYIYDRTGRLRFSQNSKQKAISGQRFSYTNYDEFSRIVEVGETSGDPQSKSVESATSGLWDITKTIYDAVSDQSARFVNGQQLLRNRVSVIQFYEGAYTPRETSSTHYSYDEHGNVKELLQVNYGLSLSETTTENSFKYMRYTYDLVSGKVKEVAYQPGKGDQFYHRYLYDADDRLKIALTSYNGLTWEKDAKYFYYKHGPLARVELGEDKVQGLDYAYTINGWMKGINASTLDASRDMGKDAVLNNRNGYVGKDAMGFSLGYYDGDYASIASSSWEAITASTPLSSGIYHNLYNGNISRTVSSFTDASQASVATMGKTYSYDQLNRIKTANAFTNVDVSGSDQILTDNTFSGASDNGTYSEGFSYDQNGNITAVDRYGKNAGSRMDQLIYNYVSGNNKLSYVSDNTGLSGNYDDDIDNQSSGNYTYWENGDLKTDSSENISVEWNVYGKMRKINRSGGNKDSIEFTYDASGNRLSKIVKTAGMGEDQWRYTYYTRDAQGNVMAVYERNLIKDGSTVRDKYSLKEHHLYGSSRLGIEKRIVALGELDFTYSGMSGNKYSRAGTGSDVIYTVVPDNKRTVGDKEYELSNHLGNVLVSVMDKKKGIDADNAGTEKQAESYTARVVSAQDYYAFGAIMQGRGVVSSLKHRYGFNGKENDNEVKGEGNQLDFGARIYDPRLGRFLSIDPKSKKYPWNSPYNYAEDRPIDGIDENGESWKWVTWRFWETKEVKAARVFADQVGGQVNKIDAHNATVYVPETSKYSEILKSSVIFTVNQTLGSSELTKDQELIVQAAYTYFDFTESNYQDYFKKSDVSLAGGAISVPYAIPLPIVDVTAAGNPSSVDFEAVGKMATISVLNTGVFTPEREIENDPRTGGPVIDGEAQGTWHTQLGRRTGSNGTYPKRRTITEDGKVEKEVEHTDHGRPQNHPNPHQHKRDPESGKRGDAEPVSND